MHDQDLKKLLLEIHPVRPGQEQRAWIALKERLTPPSRWVWLYYPTWHGATFGLLALCVLAGLGDWIVQSSLPVALASADSESPGIYATAFYSNAAHAQVIWLTGLNPSTDQTAARPAAAANTPDRL